jgi:mannose-1-phosphate guanylyltransferase
LVAFHLPELPDENILCEPSMNNTAPCIAYAAVKFQDREPGSTFAVLPSDHVILKEDKYTEILNQGFELAEKKEVLVTLGIQPTRPDTGYGYIQYDPGAGEALTKELACFKVKAFREKPDAETARQYINAGGYVWNAGMFIWNVNTILDAFTKHAGDILDILNENPGKFNTEEEQAYINRVYPRTRNISIDYAIMEKADNVYTIPADIGWSDLGTWNSLHQYLAGEDNRVTIGQNIHLYDCEDVIVRSDNAKTIVIKGLKNYIVVDEDNALLIYPKNEEQDIKQVISALKV